MNRIIEIERPQLFNDYKIISGVTRRNAFSFAGQGFTVSGGYDTDEAVFMEHRKILAEGIGISNLKFKYQKQVHGNFVRVIDSDSEELESDAMITQVSKIVLAVKIADCAAVLLYDKAKNVVAAIHSGWRGTKLNISSKTISEMNNHFGSRSDNLLAYISPCASGENYEVGEEVAQFFPRSVKVKGNGKYLFDNKNEIRLQLLESGLKESNIEISPICTISDESFHSYRRDGVLSGRAAAFIGMI